MPLSPFVDSLKDAAKSAVCQALGASSAFGDAIVSAWQDVTGIQANPPDLAGIAKGLLCNAPSPPFPPTNTGYGGANCVCDRYRISYRLKRRGGLLDLVGSETFFGPIASIALGPIGAGPYTRIDFLCRGKVGIDSGCTPGFVSRPSVAGDSGGTVIGFEITSVQNLTNPSANCTPLNPAPPTPLPDTGLPIPPFSFDFSPSVDVQTPAVTVIVSPILFQPYLDFDANIIVPISLDVNLTVGAGNFSIDASVNINTGDVNLRFGGGTARTGGGGAGYRPPSDCDDADEPVRTPPPRPPQVPGKPTDPDVEEKTILSGVIVTTSSVTLTNKATEIAQGSNPAIYAPALGFVNFYLEIGENKNPAWTADIPVKNRLQFIPCPYEEGAANVAGTPNPGVNWSLTPVYKKIRSQLPKQSNKGA